MDASDAVNSPENIQPNISDNQTNFNFCESHSTSLTSTSVSAGEERTSKRPRLIWTPHLHKTFVDAVDSVGLHNATPREIMKLMNVDGLNLTRASVTAHLSTYRFYLRRKHQLSWVLSGKGDETSSALQLFNEMPQGLPGEGNSAGAHQVFDEMSERNGGSCSGEVLESGVSQQEMTLLSLFCHPDQLQRSEIRHIYLNNVGEMEEVACSINELPALPALPFDGDIVVDDALL